MFLWPMVYIVPVVLILHCIIFKRQMSFVSHKRKINSTKFIQLYLLAPLSLLHINERTESYITNYALDILV